MAKGIPKILTSFYWTLRRRLYRPQRRARRVVIIVLAYIWRRLLFRTTFIAITGSTGKTTTKDFLAKTLEQKYSVMKTPGSWNHRKFLGPEMTILKTRPWHRYAVLEAGIENPGDMDQVAKLLKPDIAIILNVKCCHYRVFGSVESIAEEKSKLVKHLRKNGVAILNQDNPLTAGIKLPAGVKVLRFGESSSNDVQLLSSQSTWPDRCELKVAIGDEIQTIKTQLLGAHWSPSVLAAIAASNYCNVPMTDAIAAIQKVEPVWSRMQPICLEAYDATFIRGEYHASLDDLEVAFEFMKNAKASRKLVVLSDFCDSDMKSRPRANMLGKMAASCADVALFVGSAGERCVKSAINAGMKPESALSFISTAQATEFLKNFVQKDDLVLIKGLTSHHLSRVYLGLLGDVKCSLESCSKQHLCDTCPKLGFNWNSDLEGLMAPPNSYV